MSVSIAGNIVTNGRIKIGTLFLLDQYTASAVAYSLRKLRTGYTGSAIRIRRSNDNAEQDIGFINGDLDENSILSFVGSNNAFVTTWYDQSGNGNNATQTTTSKQPQLVTSGIINKQNSKPCINFDFVDDSMLSTYTINIPYTIITCFSQNNVQTNQRVINSNSSLNSLISNRRTANNVYAQGNIRNTGYGTNGIAFLGIFITKTGSGKFYYNGTDITETNTANNFGTLALGASTTFNEAANAKISEVVVYASDRTNIRSGIEENLNDYYKLY